MGRRDADPRPPVEVWGIDAPPDAEVQRVEVGRRSGRRAPILAVVAVVILVVAGLVLGGGDDAPSSTSREQRDNGDSADRSTTSTTRPRATSTTTVSSPSTTQVFGPIFTQPTGAAVLLPRESSDRWIWLDLDTGLLREVRVATDDPFSPVPVRGGLVVIRSQTARFVPLPDGLPVEMGPAEQILASGLPDAVWLLQSGEASGLPGGTGTVARLVDLAGGVRSTVALPQISYAFAATPEGLVFSAGGRTYLAGTQGVRVLADGEALAASGPFVVLLACDEHAACSPVVLDTRTGHRDVLPFESTVIQPAVGALISDAGEVAVLSYLQVSRVTLYDADGRMTGTAEGLPIDSSVRWLPEGLGLVASGQDGIVRIVPDGAGGLVVERILGLEDERSDLLLVIPG